MSSYKAWTYKSGGYPDCLEQIERETSQKLGPTQLQVQVKAAALNPVDVQLMNFPIWSLPYFSSQVKGLGADFAGIILKVGSDLNDKYKAGDEVFGLHFVPGGSYGALAEILKVDTKAGVVAKKPEDWTWEEAAALPLVYLTARTCMEQVEPYVSNSANKTVAVLGGSSATGMYNVHLAKQRGWRVVATCSGRNKEFVKGMGADEVVDYTSESVSDRLRTLKPVAIIDCVGGTECHGIAPRYVTIVGDKTSRLAMGGSATYFWTPYLWIRWALGKVGLGEVYDCIELHVKSEFLEESVSLPKDKIIIDNTFDFSQLREAYERLNTGRARGKVVVKVAQ